MKIYEIKINFDEEDERELTLGERLIINQLERSERYGARLYRENLELKAKIDKLKKAKSGGK